MAKQLKTGAILPADTFFYTILLELPGQRLTREILDKHYPVPKGRKAFMGNHYEFKSYANGIVSVKLNLNDNSENTLSLHTGLDELHIACTCGMSEGKLCYHAYMGLNRITWQGYLDFQRYYWPGYDADEKIKKKFLNVEISKERIFVEPKLRYGNIFRPNIGFTDNKHLSIEERSVKSEKELTVTGNRQVISYCLAYSFGGYFSAHLPTLIPCLGLTSKDDRFVVSFQQFSRKDKPVNQTVYTSSQQQLNEISFNQYAIAKRYDDLPDEEKRAELPNAKQAILILWQQAIPLLLNEKYNYRYYTYWLKYLKDKPRKADMKDCKYSLESPVLSFVLKFHQDHFSFVAMVSVNGSPLQFDYKPHFFVFDAKTELCYLMPSVQDDDLLMWVLSNNKRLTILKEHFTEFHDTFLNKVSLCYDVIFQNNSGVKIKYVFENVLKETK
jgi:hypothetical protein